VVRHLGKADGVTSAAGVNRVTWNLTEDGPVKWRGTPKWNQGPDDGPEAIPGGYTVRLRDGQTTLTRDLTVAADPRAPWTHDQYVERHAFLSELFSEESNVDAALNRLDALRKQLENRRPELAPRRASGQLLAQLDAVAKRAEAIFATLTSNPKAGQDSDFLPDQLRERIEYVIGSVTTPLGMGTGDYGASYLGPPQDSQYKEAAEVRLMYGARMSMYERFLKENVGSLNAALQAEGLKPLLP
jgi:hypothetical protein